MSETVDCPNCGSEFRDLWDYTWSGEEVETECGECGTEVTIGRAIYAVYSIRGKAAPNEQ